MATTAWSIAERASPSSVRFGFDDSTEAVEWISTSLAQAWKITIDGCRRMVLSGPNAIAWAE